MQIYILLSLVSLTFSCMSMDLQPGQKVTWHTRNYIVTRRIAHDNKVTVVMTRPSHHMLCVPVAIEEITRTYEDQKTLIDTLRASNNYHHPEITTSRTILTQAGVKGIQSSLLLTAFLATYYF